MFVHILLATSTKQSSLYSTPILLRPVFLYSNNEMKLGFYHKFSSTYNTNYNNTNVASP